MVQAFEFEDGGRTFKCSAEAPRKARAESWWWFGVSGDNNRYAPFQTAPDDTQANVRTRVIAYYVDLLERRSRPAVPRQHWANRAKPAATTP
jgi:hypothetical protein